MFIWARTCAHIGAHIWSAGLEKGRFDFCKGIGRRLGPVTPKRRFWGRPELRDNIADFHIIYVFALFGAFVFFWRVKIGPLFRFLKMRKFRPCNYRIVQFEFKCPTPNIIRMKFSPRTYGLTRKWLQNNVILSKISTRFARICHAIGKIQARIQEICNKDFKRHMILINIESDCLKIVCPLKSLLKISLDPCLAKYSVTKNSDRSARHCISKTKSRKWSHIS